MLAEYFKLIREDNLEPSFMKLGRRTGLSLAKNLKKSWYHLKNYINTSIVSTGMVLSYSLIFILLTLIISYGTDSNPFKGEPYFILSATLIIIAPLIGYLGLKKQGLIDELDEQN